MRRRDCLAALAFSAAVSRANAATFPERPIILSNGYPPGGSTDVAARLIMDGMMRAMPNSRVIVENRPGASGTIACDWLRRQTADGYSLLLSESSSFAIWPSMHAEGTRYDPLADFDWVSTVCTAPLVFIVSPDFPAKTVEEAIDVLRSPKSEKLDYSSSGAGSIPHIAAEMLRKVVGDTNQSRHVSYRGGAPAVLSVSKGETGWGVASLGSAAGLLQGGGLRALAVTGAKRFPSFPDVPTFTERGLPEMEVEIYYLVHAPARLPGGIHETLSAAVASALQDETVRSRFIAAGMEAWTGPNTATTTRAIVTAELKRFKDISARTGIRISA